MTDARHVLFVTGRLAEPALSRVLAEMAPPFAYDVAVLGITVAALMTTAWIARFLQAPEGTDLVLIPGLCEGDPQVIGDKLGVRVEKGTQGSARDTGPLRPDGGERATTARGTSKSSPRSTTRRGSRARRCAVRPTTSARRAPT